MLSGPARAQIEVSGRLDLPGGGAAVGIEVALLPQVTRYEYGSLVLAGRHYAEPVASARTDDYGDFYLDAPEAGMWRLLVAAKGFRPMTYDLVPLLADTLVPDLELTAESEVRLRIRDADGRPLSDARVLAEPPPRQRRRGVSSDGWRPAWRQAFADDRGVARLGRAADEALHVYAHAPGHLEAERAGIRTDSAELRLERAAPVPLRIVDLDGRPVPEAQLRIGQRRWPLGVSDAEGRFVAPMEPSGEQPVMVLTSDGRRTEPWLDPSSWKKGEDRDVELPIEPLRSGRLIDAASDTPMAGAFVWVAGRAAAFARTDARGGYSLRTPIGGNLWIAGAAPGYVTEMLRVESPDGPTLRLHRAVTARGVVVDQAGEPVEGVEIAAEIDPSQRFSRSNYGALRNIQRTVSAREGGFSISGLHPEVSYLLVATVPGYASTTLPLPKPASDARDELRIELTLGKVVSGTVIGPQREPVVGARIALQEAQQSTSSHRMMRTMWTEPTEKEGWTGTDGRFSFFDLAPGSYSIRISASGYAVHVRRAIDVPQGPGEADLGELPLELGAPVEGRVTDQDGSPLEGAEVHVSEETFFTMGRSGEPEPEATSDSAGMFTFASRADGETVDLEISLDGYVSEPVRGVAVPTHRPLEVKLWQASRISGRVVDASDEPVAGAQFHTLNMRRRMRMSSSTSSGRTESDSDGVFVIEGVAPGEIHLVIRAEGFVASELKDLVVEPGQDLEDVIVRLERGATVLGRVTDVNGLPVADVEVATQPTARSFTMAGRASTRSGDDGRYRLDGVRTGRQSIVATHADHAPVEKSFDVEAGENQLDIAFEASVEISGRIVDSLGAPIGGAHVGLSGRGRFRSDQAVRTDSSGAFSLDFATPGTNELTADADGFAPRTEKVEVGPGGLSGVEIRLDQGAAIVGRILGLDERELAGIEVFANTRQAWAMGVVAADGTYRIEDLAPGKYSLSAHHQASGRSAEGTVDVVDGTPETVLDLEFDDAGLVLTGQVLDGGEPLDSGWVTVQGVDVASGGGGELDHDGRFEINGLEEGRHTLHVMGFSGEMVHREEIDVTRSTDIVVRVATAQLSGHVTDATSGEPIAGAELKLESTRVSNDPMMFFGAASETTDSNGFFRFSEASVGDYLLRVQRDGYAPSERSITVSEGIDEEVEIRLSPTEGVRVRVVLPTGQSARQFYAAALDASGRTVMSGAYSSGDEGVRLSIAPGDWELLLSADGSATTSRRISVPSPPIEARLEGSAQLTIRVPELEGAQVLSTIRCTGPDGRPFRFLGMWRVTEEWPMMGESGQVDGLPPGTWTVRVESRDGRVWQSQVTLAARANPELVLR